MTEPIDPPPVDPTPVEPPAEPAPEPVDSILDGTKKALGLPEDHDGFDADVMMHINSVFFTLSQLGIGPASGFAIAGPTETWGAFLGEDLNLNAVKSYMYLRVRLLFDPPPSSFAVDSMQKQAEQMEWRLNIHVESISQEIVEVVE